MAPLKTQVLFWAGSISNAGAVAVKISTPFYCHTEVTQSKHNADELALTGNAVEMTARNKQSGEDASSIIA